MSSKIAILILMLLSFCLQAHSSCFGKKYTLTEILANKNDAHHIFTCSISETYVKGGFVSIAVVDQVYRGAPKDTVRINTGGHTREGGTKLLPGNKWLVISETNDSCHYTATICYNLSLPLTDADLGCHGYPMTYYGEDYIDLIENFDSLVVNKFSGQYTFRIRDAVLANARFKSGLAHGVWSHYNYNRDIGARIINSRVEYNLGSLNGIDEKYRIDNDSLVIASSSFVDKDRVMSAYEYPHDYYEYDYPSDSIQLNKYYRLNATKDTVRLSCSRTYVDLTRGDLKIQYRHGAFYNYIDSSNFNPLCKGHYFHGARVGHWLFYDKNGVVVDEKNYEWPKSDSVDFVVYNDDGSHKITRKRSRDKRTSIWNFYEDDLLMYQEYCSDTTGLISRIRFYSSGNRQVILYKNGRRHGDVYVFNSNDQLIESTSFVQGVKNGTHIEYDDSGAVIYESYFRHGVENTVYHRANETYEIDGFSNGYKIQYNDRTHQKIFEGEFWMGYRTGIFKTYEKNGDYIKSFYETDKVLLMNTCGQQWPLKTENYNSKDERIAK